MKKKADAEIAAALPKIGCEVCLPGGEGFAGFVYVERPGAPRAVDKCACRIKREQAKKALVAS